MSRFQSGLSRLRNAIAAIATPVPDMSIGITMSSTRELYAARLCGPTEALVQGLLAEHAEELHPLDPTDAGGLVETLRADEHLVVRV